MMLDILPEKVIKGLRMSRAAAMRALGPADHIVRLANNKRGYPPLWLRMHVGGLGDFEVSGGEYMAYLKLLCGMRPGHMVLDIGCGCGLLALRLNGSSIGDYLGPAGRYVGIDTHRASVDWCSRNINGHYANCLFEHMDMDPGTAGTYRFKYNSYTFDIVVLKSVLTHLMPDAVLNYIKETSRLLVDGGACLATFFFVNDTQRRLAADGLNSPMFRHRYGSGYCVRKSRPELAMAYEEDHVIAVAASHDLEAERVLYGTWSGRAGGVSYQDMAIFRKRER